MKNEWIEKISDVIVLAILFSVKVLGTMLFWNWFADGIPNFPTITYGKAFLLCLFVYYVTLNPDIKK